MNGSHAYTGNGLLNKIGRRSHPLKRLPLEADGKCPSVEIAQNIICKTLARKITAMRKIKEMFIQNYISNMEYLVLGKFALRKTLKGCCIVRKSQIE